MMKTFLSGLPTDLIQKFLATDVMTSLYISGGCSSILGWLTLMPGSSKNVAETRNPYIKSALVDLLGYVPTSFVDISVSRDLAFKAFVNTQSYLYLENENNLHFEHQRILGIGATGALKSNYVKKGDHHLYVSFLDQNKLITYYILLDKDKRTREEEDYFLSANMINLINISAGDKVECPELIGEVLENDKISIVEHIDTVDFLLPRLEKQVKNIIFLPKGKILADQVVKKCVIIPGSFNPIHEGHIELGDRVAEKFGVQRNNVIFELSALNADKGLISREELDKRVKAIVEKGFTAMLTLRPFFYSKNEYLREGYFVVGADTYKRIIDTKYYDNSKEVMLGKLGEFGKYKNCLVVAPRLNSQTNTVEKLGDFVIVEVLKDWIHELEDFRNDISSTEIRKMMEQKEKEKQENK